MGQGEKRILLIGNPNVGKSSVFSRLTGAKVTISNYPGTTVGFSQGYIKLGGDEPGMVIDVPGIYNLKPLRVGYGSKRGNCRFFGYIIAAQ